MPSQKPNIQQQRIVVRSWRAAFQQAPLLEDLFELNKGFLLAWVQVSKVAMRISMVTDCRS